MAEAFYRLKSAGGDWTRVTGTAPITITGLTEGVVYEFVKGDGTIGEVTSGVALVIPTVAASDSLSGQTLTISVDSLTGDPAPTPVLSALSLDAGSVLGAETGTGPWNYVVPDSANAQTVAWTVEATNGAGTDTASGSEVVPANLFAPTFATLPTITGTIEPGSTVTLNEGTFSGTTPITATLTLTLNGTDVTADVTGSTYTIPASTEGQSLVLDIALDNGVSPSASASDTRTVQATVTGSNTVTGSFAGNTLVVDSSDSGTMYLTLVPDIEATPSETQIIAGQKSDGSPAPYFYSSAITTGNQNLSPDLSGVAEGAYKFCIIVQDGGATNSNILVLVETLAAPAVVVDEGASTGTFTSSGGFRIWEGVPGNTLVVSANADFSALLVGDGGNGRYTMAGGSGGGEFVHRALGTNPLTLTAGSYTVNKADNATDRGNDWTFATLTALGGGRGMNPSNLGTGHGGSGGGSSGNVGQNTPGASIAVDGIGFEGGPANANGTRGGGGGSPLGSPSAADANKGGNGFDGIPSPVPGESGIRYSPGGGAGSSSDATRGLGGLGGGGDGGGDVTLATDGQNGRGAGAGGAGGTGAGGVGGTGTIKIWWPE